MSDTGTVTPEEENAAETLARWKWGAVIFGFLGLQILISGIAIFLATSDPSNVIVEGYYEQALSWDEQREMQAASDALGWTSEIQLEQPQGIQGERVLNIHLQDLSGQPITGQQLAGELFHHARAGDVYRLQFREIQPGNYTTVAPLNRSGLWELALKTSDPSHRFQETKQIKLKDSGDYQTIATRLSNGQGTTAN